MSYMNVGNIGKESSTWILSKVANKVGEKTLYSNENIDSHILDLKKEGVFREISKILINFKNKHLLESAKKVSEQELEKVSDDLIYIYRGTITQMSKEFLEELTKGTAKEVVEAI